MTGTETSTELRVRAAGPGPWDLDPVHFPAPGDALLGRDAPGAVQRGHQRLRALLRDAHRRRSRCAYVNGFALQPGACRRPRRRSRSASQRAEEVFARKLWREQLRDWDETRQAGRDRDAPRDPGGRSRRALRRRSWSRTSTRCRDHHAAMIAQHMRFTAGGDDPDRRLPRARRRLDRAAARRAARPDARRRRRCRPAAPTSSSG